MSRGFGLIVILALVAFVAAYAASPILAFQQLKTAAEQGDHDRLEALVDFPAVREDLKRQVDSRAVKLARDASGVGYPIAAILGKLGSALGDRSIDRLVTPEAISAMVRSGLVPHRHKHDSNTGAAPAADDPSGTVTRYAYLTPDRFRVSVAPAQAPDRSIGLIMDRRGLFSWRLEAIELPK